MPRCPSSPPLLHARCSLSLGSAPCVNTNRTTRDVFSPWVGRTIHAALHPPHAASLPGEPERASCGDRALRPAVRSSGIWLDHTSDAAVGNSPTQRARGLL